MQEFVKKLIERLEESAVMMANSKEFWNNPQNGNYVSEVIPKDKAIAIIAQLVEEYNNGWIPCEIALSPKPREGEEPEIYLICSLDDPLPFRAFWDGTYFTQGFRRESAVAWQPLPPKYEPKGE